MNSKNKNVLILVVLFIIVSIFLDIIFNFSGIAVENFSNQNSMSQIYNSNSNSKTENSYNSSNTNKNSIKSIISKISGKVLSIEFVDSDPTNSTINIPSPTTDKYNITVNNDGTLSEETNISAKPEQQFTIKNINNISDYRKELEININNGADISSSCTKYPFYIIKSNSLNKKNPPWCLAYEAGNLFVHPIGNYDNQKWELSNIEILSKSFCTNNVNSTSIGQMRSNPDNLNSKIYNKDKIKINLNLNDDLKTQLFGIDESNSSGSSSNSKCPTYLPKKSINSLCKGCDTDKL